MKKKTLIIILIVVVLLILGYFGLSNSCKDSCGNCKLKFLNIPVLDLGFKTCPLIEDNIVGGCAGVYYIHWNECCRNWAEENNISHTSCLGNWTVEDNKCRWVCSSG